MSLKTVIKENPVAFQGGLFGVVSAGLLLLQEFGVPISERQGVAIGGFVAALFILLLVMLRAQVTPAVKVVAQTSGSEIVAGDASVLPTGLPVVVGPVEPAVHVITSNTPLEDEQRRLAEESGARRALVGHDEQ
jgi:hypothetical protein